MYLDRIPAVAIVRMGVVRKIDPAQSGRRRHTGRTAGGGLLKAHVDCADGKHEGE